MTKKAAELTPETIKHLLNLKPEPVNSSNLKAVAYTNGDTKILVIQFHGGQIWAYTPVTLEAFHEFKRADSLGKWFNANLKNNNLVSAFKLVG